MGRGNYTIQHIQTSTISSIGNAILDELNYLRDYNGVGYPRDV